MSPPPDGVRLLEPGEGALWDELVLSARVPFFADREWVDHTAAAVGGAVEVVGAFQGGRLVGGVALPVRRRMGLRLATPPYLQPYQEIVTGDARTRSLRDILPFVAKRYPLVSLLPPPGEEDLRAYRTEGWELAYRYTSRVDLAGVTRDSMLGRVDGAQRRRIRRAGEQNLEVRDDIDPAEHCRLVLASYGRQKKAFPLGEERELDLVRWIVETGRGLLYGLVRGDRAIASSLVGVAEKTAYALEGGVDPDFRQGGETSYLHIRMMEDLAARGFDSIDLLGMNHPTISRFKESFAGDLVRYHAAIPRRPFALRILLCLRGIPSGLEVAPEGTFHRP